MLVINDLRFLKYHKRIANVSQFGRLTATGQDLQDQPTGRQVSAFSGLVSGNKGAFWHKGRMRF